jgi:hypothetical protein
VGQQNVAGDAARECRNQTEADHADDIKPLATVPRRFRRATQSACANRKEVDDRKDGQSIPIVHACLTVLARVPYHQSLASRRRTSPYR